MASFKERIEMGSWPRKADGPMISDDNSRLMEISSDLDKVFDLELRWKVGRYWSESLSDSLDVISRGEVRNDLWKNV